MLYIKIKNLSPHLEKNQWNGKNDFRILAKYGEQQRTTNIIWNNNNPTWNETFLFDFNKNENKIIIQLIDEDVYGKPEILIESQDDIYYKKIKSFDDNIIEYDMGNIFFKKDIQIKNLKYKLENSNIKLDNISLILNE
jgi:hypothetical protein